MIDPLLRCNLIYFTAQFCRKKYFGFLPWILSLFTVVYGLILRSFLVFLVLECDWTNRAPAQWCCGKLTISIVCLILQSFNKIMTRQKYTLAPSRRKKTMKHEFITWIHIIFLLSSYSSTHTMSLVYFYTHCFQGV